MIRQEELKQEYLSARGDRTRASDLEFILIAIATEIADLESALKP